MKSSAWLSIAALSTSVALGLSGCGDDDDDDGSNMSEAGSPSAGSGTSGNGGTMANAAGSDSEGGMATAPIGGEPSTGGTPGVETGGVPSIGGTGDGGASLGVGGATAGTDVEIHADVLTDSRGFSLYIREGDTASTTDPVSGCTAGCLMQWPLFAVEDPTVPDGLSASDFRVFERPDGEMQATYQGWPLYYYEVDKEPGDTKGEGVGQIWHVVTIPFVAP